ncbi:hypothetical protein [Fodinibius sp. Rm-B-1B1-1]|uniref:hypothetical protein n=1 Tax=Fodinibius alkaliphilus TaxID=3140241 RepID=UPI00315B337F
MKEQKKKRIIAALLFISCIISGTILFSTANQPIDALESFAQADSLIENQFERFNISEQQVTVATTRVDSNFYRKTYYVALPYQFSKTQFHAALNNRFHRYSVETPARVTFPQQDVNIQLAYRGTVIRTISLQTDPELAMETDNISILMVFDELPDGDILSNLRSLAEPIPLVIKVEKPLQVQDIKEELNGRYTPVIFWLHNQNGDNVMEQNSETAITQLKRLERISPNSNVLVTGDAENNMPNLRTFTKLSFVKVTESHMLTEQMGKDSFISELRRLTSNATFATTLITGSSSTVNWLKEELPDLKTSGINIIAPMNL